MYNYLVDHAIENVWCNPEQDNQIIFRAKKLTNSDGDLNFTKVLEYNIPLPNLNKRYHIFQIGQIGPKLLGLINLNYFWQNQQWFTFAEAMNANNLIATIYTSLGIELPRYKSYYMLTNTKNLIFAVEVDDKFKVDFNNEHIYLRLYSNAYFQTNRDNMSTEEIVTNGMNIVTTQDILDMQNQVAAYKALPGYVFCYCNGYLVNNINLLTVATGDSVEFVYDSSVKKTVTYTASNLKTFISILDSKVKYLLHDGTVTGDTIDYHDDIEIHIYHELNSNSSKGYYYCRNGVDSHRMVTHKDYSIPVGNFTAIATELRDNLNLPGLNFQNLKILVNVRDAGYKRNLINENNRIKELYKLNPSDVIKAMVGLDATVSEWKAENLENSPYCLLMGTSGREIDIAKVQSSYGYNSMSKILADTPSKTTLVSGRQSVLLPYGLHANSTMYEYDINGYLLEHNIHTVGSDYECVNNNARIVEGIVGEASDRPIVLFGTDNIPLPIYHNYRVYVCHFFNGDLDHIWSDITDSEHYEVVNNVLVWNNLDSNHYIMVRTDEKFLHREYNLLPIAGTLYLTLSEFENRLGVDGEYVLPVPMGQLDVFLNGKSLIKNLDYVLKFPTLYIINKEYLIQPANSTPQHIVIRFTGFCNSDLTVDQDEDVGFIEHGVLSNNNKFDIRDDKVMRITFDGKLKTSEDVIFSELHQGVSIVNAINGRPYQIKDIIVPLKQLVSENTYSLRNKAIAIDDRVSNYLSLKVPQPERNAVSSIPQKYQIVSPFLCHILNDMAIGQINNTEIEEAITDTQVINFCSQYEFLLDYDPINPAFNVNSEYVLILPHNLDNTIDLNHQQYTFINKVVRLYGNGLVNLSPFVTITT